METAAEVGKALLNVLNILPVEVYETVISALFATSFGIWVKRFVTSNRDGIMVANVVGAAMMAASVAYLANNPKYGPWLIVAQGAIAYVLSQGFFFKLVKPVKKELAHRKEVKASEADEKLSARVPEGGLTL